MVNKEEYFEQGLTEVVGFISSASKKNNPWKLHEENVIIPSVTVISEDYLSSVHVLLYTTALKRDYAIRVSMTIHAMAFKNFSSLKTEAAGQMKEYVTLEFIVSTACLDNRFLALSCLD